MNAIKQFQSDHGLKADGIIGKNTLAKMRCVFGGITDAQLAHFLANIDHETGGYTRSVENLNYSVNGLLDTFKKYFTPAKAKLYARQPEKIANLVYANRMGNGDESSGDGWKYRGRGGIQLTGKNNYIAFARYVGDVSIITNPEKVSTDYFWQTAKFYFDENFLWNKAKGETDADVKAIRRAVNGGYNGLDDVRAKFAKYLKLIRN